MSLSRRVTGALAWGGLVVIIGIPSAEVISARVDGERTVSTRAAATDPVETASLPQAVAPAAVAKPEVAEEPAVVAVAEPPAPKTVEPVADDDPVATYLKGGKPLPDYISDDEDVAAAGATSAAGAPPAGTPAADAPAGAVAAVADPASQVPASAASVPEATQVAALSAVPATAPASVQVAPTPMPASMRPTTVTVIATAPSDDVVPVILDEAEVLARTPSRGPVPPAPIPEAPYVSGDSLEGWHQGTLAEYLARNGLLSEDTSSSASADTGYDPDGFYLDEGPNGGSRRYRGQSQFILIPAN